MNKKLNFDNITLLGVDCVDVDRLLKAFEICEYYVDFKDKVLLTSLLEDKETETGIKIKKIENLDTIEKYSYFMIKRLNDFVDTDFVLTIQYDGFILNPKAWTDEFLKYDYIGAPWWFNHEYNVGNGGFSLRSKKLLGVLQEDRNIKEGHPEDAVICRIYGEYLKNKGIKFAPESLAAKFSLEGHTTPHKAEKYGTIWKDQFGFHDLKRTNIDNWKDKKIFFKNF